MGRDHTGRWGVLPCEAVLDRAGISPAYAHETILLVSNLIGSVLLIIAGVTGTAKAKKRQALRQKLECIGS